MDNPELDREGTKRWHDSNGQFHRVDGPAVEYVDGHKVWYQHGKRHRDDGPAMEWVSGAKSWYLNDIYLSFDEWLPKVKMSDEDKVMMKLQYG
jgi:hypothetical protein